MDVSQRGEIQKRREAHVYLWRWSAVLKQTDCSCISKQRSTFLPLLDSIAALILHAWCGNGRLTAAQSTPLFFFIYWHSMKIKKCYNHSRVISLSDWVLVWPQSHNHYLWDHCRVQAEGITITLMDVAVSHISVSVLVFCSDGTFHRDFLSRHCFFLLTYCMAHTVSRACLCIINVVGYYVKWTLWYKTCVSQWQSILWILWKLVLWIAVMVQAHQQMAGQSSKNKCPKARL